MNENSIYADIAKRTGGDIYIGVVGPVRTGKSTFIRRFLDSVVIPNIENEYDRIYFSDEGYEKRLRKPTDFTVTSLPSEP